MELLLSTMRPVELMAGKVLGSGILVFAQAAVLVVTALIAAQATGSPILAGSGTGALAVNFVWVVLGFLFYGFLFASSPALGGRPVLRATTDLLQRAELYPGARCPRSGAEIRDQARGCDDRLRGGNLRVPASDGPGTLSSRPGFTRLVLSGHPRGPRSRVRKLDRR